MNQIFTIDRSDNDVRALQKTIRRQRLVADSGKLFDSVPPPELLTPYPIDDPNAGKERAIQAKYTKRDSNIRRCWNRVQLYLPELMHEGAPQKIFEMSTAHAGMLEVLRHFGHDVEGNDYANMVQAKNLDHATTFRSLNDQTFSRDVDDYGIQANEDGVFDTWPYREITESVDIPVKLFDAGVVPYPLDDKSQDYLLCFQAIEHYCHPEHWMEIVHEFCRVTRKSIVLLLNPIFSRYERHPAYKAAFETFLAEMQRFNDKGFVTTSCHIHWCQPLGFKLTAV